MVSGCTGIVIHTSDSGTTPTYIVVAGAVPARGQMPQGIDVVWCLPFGFEIDMLIRPMRRRLARAAYASFGSMADDGVATEAHRLVPGV